MSTLIKRGLSCPRVASKAFLTFGLMLAGSALAPMQAQAAGPLVLTHGGPVQGFVGNLGVSEFLGIPYAAPPVGNLRWKPPVAHAAWTKTLNAVSYAPQCAQVQERPFNGPANNNEDCLYINVFTPDVTATGKGKLPVMVWSYGGGESDGESNDYDGTKLASQGHVVVVTFNYRMNLMGFLALDSLDNEGHLFGNYGLLDNQFALKWVQQNIASFGGDRNNVLIFGQSAGSRNTGAELLSPLAKGLFEHAIFESGAIPPETALSGAITKGNGFAAAAGCGSKTGAAQAKCLRSLTAAQVEALAGTVSGDSAYVTGLITDGQILPEAPLDQYISGNFNHVPIIDGDVMNEGNFALAGIEYYENPRKPLTEDQFVAYVNSTFGGSAFPAGTAKKVLAQYPLSNYASPQLQWGSVETDEGYTCPTRFVDHILATQTPLYAYEFRDQTAPIYGAIMPGFVYQAYHTSDIRYYWNNYHGGPLGVLRPLNAKQSVLSDQLIAAWTNFAATGNPNGNSVTATWPQYLPNKNGNFNNSVFFSENIKPTGLGTETDAFWSGEHHCAFWDQILYGATQ